MQLKSVVKITVCSTMKIYANKNIFNYAKKDKLKN